MLKNLPALILFQFLGFPAILSQSHKSIFKPYINREIPNNYYGKILMNKDGLVFVSASEFSFVMITGGRVASFTFGLENQDYGIKNLESVFTGAPIKAITESKEGNVFFSTAKNQLTYFEINDEESGICDIPPFYFPVKGDTPKEITQLWFDSENNLYIGVTDSAFYTVPGVGAYSTLDPNKYKIERARDSSMVILKGEIPVKKIGMGSTGGVYSFAENKKNKDVILIGTGRGLFAYSKTTGELSKGLFTDYPLTITHIESSPNGDIWFSTLEKGMGVYHQLTKTSEFFPYPKKDQASAQSFPIQDFCLKSEVDFLVAVKDSTPAIFNALDRTYKFMDDSSFVLSKNSTTDIQIDTAGNFYFIKGGLLYSANIYDNPEWIGSDTGKLTYSPLIYRVTDFNKRDITDNLTNAELLENLKLKYNENSIIIYLASNYFSQNKTVQYAWRLDGDVNNWVEMPAYDAGNDSAARVELIDLKPGKYNFRVRVKVGEGEWSAREAHMPITIAAPYWAAWWFWTVIVVSLSLIFYIIIKLRINAVKRRERQRAQYEKELFELEAKALRAQMNPHFIFNCMNSIKSLIQQDDKENAASYLTTFSKLIRTIFQNSDKREVTLFDELETCRLYTQLEAMRFGNKLSYSFDVDETIDLKSIMVPALILQPFIENAIWHGIMPKANGGVLNITIVRKDDKINCIIEDDGIGRELSMQNKFDGVSSAHQSRGVRLTQSRLELSNTLNQRNATVEIIDKKNGENGPAGTKVILGFNQD